MIRSPHFAGKSYAVLGLARSGLAAAECLMASGARVVAWDRQDNARAVLEGWVAKDGRLPVNPSGGLKAKGHPIGATGVSMHAIAAMQLTGRADTMQLPRADRAGVFNMGGAAVANYVSILERLE